MTPETIIREHVTRSGLTKGRESDITFYIAAWRTGALNDEAVRKIGRQLTAAEKRERGIACRGMLTAEFLDTLSPAGMIDPVDSAWRLTAPARTAIACAEQLARTEEVGLPVVFIASEMQAGPCARAAAMQGRRMAAKDAPLVPFPQCEHPDQCGCMYQAKLGLTGEF